MHYRVVHTRTGELVVETEHEFVAKTEFAWSKAFRPTSVEFYEGQLMFDVKHSILNKQQN